MLKSDIIIILLAFSAAGFALLHGIEATKSHNIRLLIEECESNLPRNQHCVLTAVPEEK